MSNHPPTVAQACLGLGHLAHVFEPGRETQTVVQVSETTTKDSGSVVDTGIFHRDEYRWLSGVVLSCERLLGAISLGVESQFLHTPNAEHQLPRFWYRDGLECWFEIFISKSVSCGAR